MKEHNQKKTEPTASADVAPAVEPPVQILVRLNRDEVAECKEDTGATADATAVACFVRKNLRKGKPQG
jgi:hypothetical protein